MLTKTIFTTLLVLSLLTYSVTTTNLLCNPNATGNINFKYFINFNIINKFFFNKI